MTPPTAMPSLDANCVLRWLLGDIPEQTAQVEHLLADGRTFHVADAAIIETVFVLERQARIDRATVRNSIETLMAEASIDMDRLLWADMLEPYIAKPKLSVADIYLARTAARMGNGPLYTFDKKMLSQLPECASPPDLAPEPRASTT